MGGIYLLLGSNQGDKRSNISRAKDLIESDLGEITRESGIYKTAAWGNEDQDEFLNQVIEVDYLSIPENLLNGILKVEKELGRSRSQKWGPRIIDIDILYFGEVISFSPDLTIPHPQIQNRRFTLVPLVEIAPGFVHPLLNKTNSKLLDECDDKLDVELAED